jgi:RNA polymerase sigma-70 factor (ECF subfamily)
MRIRATPPIDPPEPGVERAAAGDLRARRALVEGYGPLVYSLCRRLDPSPDDAYQEIWEKAFRALGRFDPGGSARFSTWLTTLAHRHLIDRHRRRRTRGEVLSLEGLASEQPGAEAALSRRQREVQLERALQRLPIAQRRVVVLPHINGLSLETIASQEGVAVGTIKSRLHRGRARLAQLLGGC